MSDSPSPRSSVVPTLLNDKNIRIWKQYLKAALKRKNLWSIVSGMETRPNGAPHTRAVRAFTRRQEEAAAMIVLSVEPSQLHLCEDDNPAVQFATICSAHLATGLASRLVLKRRFNAIALKPSQSISSLYADTCNLVDDLRSIGVTVTEEDIIIALTQGLPPAYDMAITSFDTFDPDALTINFVLERLQAVEAQLVQRAERTTDTTPKTKAKSQPVDQALAVKPKTPIEFITCFSCGKKGHYQRTCPEPKPPAEAAANIAFAGHARALSPILAF